MFTSPPGHFPSHALTANRWPHQRFWTVRSCPERMAVFSTRILGGTGHCLPEYNSLPTTMICLIGLPFRTCTWLFLDMEGWMGQILGPNTPCQHISLGHASWDSKITQVSSWKEFHWCSQLSSSAFCRNPWNLWFMKRVGSNYAPKTHFSEGFQFFHLLQ